LALTLLPHLQPLGQPAESAKEPLIDVLKKAGHKALGGGIAGAVAMFAQVGALM
jgi:hypothetical protein